MRTQIKAYAEEVLSKVNTKVNINSVKKAWGFIRKFAIKNTFQIFIFLSLVYFEILYRIFVFNSITTDFIYPFIVSIPASGLIILNCSLINKRRFSIIAASVILIVTTILYGLQIVYYSIFRTYFSFYSLGGTTDALQMQDIVFTALYKNIPAIILLVLPIALLLIFRKKLVFQKLTRIFAIKWLGVVAGGSLIFIMMLSITGNETLSAKDIYYNEPASIVMSNKLGLLITMRTDVNSLIVPEDELSEDIDNLGFEPIDSNAANASTSNASNQGNDSESNKNSSSNNTANNNTSNNTTNNTSSDNTTNNPSVANSTNDNDNSNLPAKTEYNVMDIDFDSLIKQEKNATIKSMHAYFKDQSPTEKNEYTGMFKGCNLILITAEGFSPYVISKELTPTLYEMSTEGFVFKNFYNPVWGVSTSDGEYVACTGLYPKTGVWSFKLSGKNYMPFAFGNQFKSLGYTTNAYHNHSYTYYGRDVSHPNLGYTYKGVGNGLKITKTWPESDLEMMQVTVPEYINNKPFHTYYMTVSGHMNYTFEGNSMARKNKQYVEHLQLSDSAKAYIACNMELEFAMKHLVESLDAQGILENTVIAISPDHYPYGLEKKYIDELAGHEVESNFELYKSSFILWKKGMKSVTVEKNCSSVDIAPTISNLFGLKYDSRLLMGKDILSNNKALVVFNNKSWITDLAMYNSITRKVSTFNGESLDKDYVTTVNKQVDSKLKISAKILETDYFKKVLE